MYLLLQLFESFIRKSELNVYNPENHCGFWKQLTVRLGVNTSQVMVVVGVNVHGVTQEQLQQITSDIVNFFVNEDGKSCNVTSLYLQADDMTYDSNLINQICYGCQVGLRLQFFFQGKSEDY